jgi:DNA-binding SARP family transcriptional activator
MEEQQMSTLQIFLLGPPRIVRAEKRISDHLSQKAIGLLAYLAVGSARGYTREKLAGLFWGETDEKHANFNLRRALWSLRKAITLPTEPTDAYIHYEERQYSFNRFSDYWVDTGALERTVSKWSDTYTTPLLCPPSGVQYGSFPDLNKLRDAIHLYRGEFLESLNPRGCPEFLDWMTLERDRLRQQFVRGLLALAGEVAEQGDHEQAIAYYRRLLRVDPLNEAAHRALMVIYHILGEQEASLGVYYSFRRVVREQLGLEPTPAIQALFQVL